MENIKGKVVVITGASSGLAERPKLQAEVELLKMNTLSSEEVVSEGQALHDRWPELPTESKRRIVERIIEKLVVADGEIEITFFCLASSEEMTKSQKQLRGPG